MVSGSYVKRANSFVRECTDPNQNRVGQFTRCGSATNSYRGPCVMPSRQGNTAWSMCRVEAEAHDGGKSVM